MFPGPLGASNLLSDGPPVLTDMKNPVEVLRRKEAELERLQEEVDALRLVGKLLRDQTLAGKNGPQARGKILQMP